MRQQSTSKGKGIRSSMNTPGKNVKNGNSSKENGYFSSKLSAVQLMQLQRTFGNQVVLNRMNLQTSGQTNKPLPNKQLPPEKGYRKPKNTLQVNKSSIQKEENKTGMPESLKDGFEAMSGLDLSDVHVHYNSEKPAKLNALAYAQGKDIHLGPGQEKHLPHEGWHIVQQRQGRVRPTLQMKSGVYVNDDESLETEADVMGNKASQIEISSEGIAQRKYHVMKNDSQRSVQLTRGNIKKTTDDEKERKKRHKVIENRRRDARQIEFGEGRKKYKPGMHGYKKQEQHRLSKEFIPVSGDTHESEHTVGFEPLIRNSKLQRSVGRRARGLENLAPAYQEIKELHRNHIGTGTKGEKDESGFTSKRYRFYQRKLIESGDVSSAVQINQLGYAHDNNINKYYDFDEKKIWNEGELKIPENHEKFMMEMAAKAANDSYDIMVKNMDTLTYAEGENNIDIPVDAKQKAEMYLARRAMQDGNFPTIVEENEARRMFGLPPIRN